MAKKQKTQNIPVTKSKAATPVEEPIATVNTDPLFPEWMSNFKIQAIIIAVLSFLLYSNTVNNEYALDDTAVILKNEYVYQGFAGIPSILTKDAFDSYYKQFKTGNQLSGGRYRPLSIVTFAIEQQFMGTVPDSKLDSVVTHADEKGPQEKILNHNMHIRHFFNVLWFTLSVVILLYFLRYVVFRSNPIMAFMATILFTIHPIHTEVVANVKSRDEIMSLAFMCLTFIFAFKYREHKQKWMLGAGLVSYFLAYLSKEYSITLMILLPLAFYLFDRMTIGNCIKATLPYVAVTVVYLMLRSQVVAPMNEDSNSDLLNNPYALASKTDKLATEISTASNYFRLLVFPHPLSADYSYNEIPYKDFAHPLVWFSLLIHITLIRLFFFFFKRKHLLSFAIGFYLFHLLLVCNLLFDIGATMGERLIYHSSVGFVIAVAWLLYEGMKKIQPIATGKLALGAFMVVVIGLCSFTTVQRNADWKNNFTLFSHDLKHSPNSVIINANVASSYIDMSNVEKEDSKKKEDLEKGVVLLHKVLSLHNTYVIGYFNLGLAFFKLGMADSAKHNFDVVKSYYPKYPRLDEFYYNLGVTYYMNKRFPEAVNCWQSTLQIQPANKDAIHALQVLNVPLQPVRR